MERSSRLIRHGGGYRLLPAVLLVGVAFVATPALAYQQSPLLDEAVEAGDLPPVEERLPSNPLVVEPVESVGQYGGVWRSGLLGGGDNAWLARTVMYEGLVRYDRNWEEIVPNIAESWDVNDDATRYTFTLREGLRWSDGNPFTSEDIEFAITLFQDSQYAASGGWMANPQNPVTIEVESDTVFTLAFENPHGLLMNQLASVDGAMVTSLSKAYCGQFYPGVNPDANEEAEAEGYQNWSVRLEETCAWGWEQERWANPDLPLMTAWAIDEPLTGTSTRMTWERNPYYFKVDPDGNQLPYIDSLNMRVSESAEELTLMALNGEIDFTDRHITTVTNRPIFFDGQEAGDYRLGENVVSNSNTMLFQLNFSHDDPVKRELFNDRNFRIGMSHALDREEIIDVVYTAQGEPYQVAPRPESPFFDEEMAYQYTEYDPELAAQYLAEAGLTERNGDGILLMEDGNPVVVNVDVIAAFRPEWIDMLELAQLHLREAGIDMQINNIDRTLFYDKRPGNDYDAQVWQGDGGLDVVEEPRYYFPANAESVWAYRWQAWYNGTEPDIAEEPADWAREQMDLYTELSREGDPDVRFELMQQILEIAREEFPVIGISLPPNGYYIARNNLRNVADDMLHGWLFPTPAPYDPAQWYFE